MLPCPLGSAGPAGAVTSGLSKSGGARARGQRPPLCPARFATRVSASSRPLDGQGPRAGAQDAHGTMQAPPWLQEKEETPAPQLSPPACHTQAGALSGRPRDERPLQRRPGDLSHFSPGSLPPQGIPAAPVWAQASLLLPGGESQSFSGDSCWPRTELSLFWGRHLPRGPQLSSRGRSLTGGGRGLDSQGVRGPWVGRGPR